MRELVEMQLKIMIDDAQELGLYKDQDNPFMCRATRNIMTFGFEAVLEEFKKLGAVKDFVVQIDDKNNDDMVIEDGSLVIEIKVKYPNDDKFVRYFYDLHADGLEQEVYESVL